MPRNLIRSHLLILCIALLAATSVMVACSGDDDEPDAPAPPAAAEQSADADAEADDEAAAEPEQRAVAEDQADEQAQAQAAEQADEPAEEDAAEQAEEDAAEQVAEEDTAEEQAVEQAAEQAEEQAARAGCRAAEQAEEQAAEQAAAAAAAEQAAAEEEAAAEQAEEQAAEQAAAAAAAAEQAAEEEEQAAEQAEEQAAPEPADEEDTPDDAAEEEVADETMDDEPLITGPLGDYAPVDDFRFKAVVKLDVTPNTSGGDTEMLMAIGDITVEGAYLASGDHEIAIMLGDSAFLPPMGIVSIGDTVYTNLGFGWESAQGSTGALVDGIAGDLLGVGGLVGGLDLQGLVAGGDLGILLTLLPYETWDDGGAETLDSGPARIYSTQHDDLAGFFASIGDALLGGLAFGMDGGPPAENGGAPAQNGGAIPPELLAELGELDSIELTLWIDEATGIVARLDLAIAGLVLKEFAGPGADLSIGALSLVLDTSPEFGVITSLVIAIDGLDMPGPDGMSGGVAITLEVTDVNSGEVVIEPPI